MNGLCCAMQKYLEINEISSTKTLKFMLKPMKFYKQCYAIFKNDHTAYEEYIYFKKIKIIKRKIIQFL